MNADKMYCSNSSGDIRRLQAFLSLLEVSAPDDYLDWIKESDGGELVVGEKHVCLFSIETTIEVREHGEHEETLPGFVAIGSDGGNNFFALRRFTRKPAIYFVDPYNVRAAMICGANLADLCSYLRELS
jgi:hypothetical protein